jgi:hypothetical protein
LAEAGYNFQTNHPAADDPEMPPGTYQGDLAEPDQSA